MFDHVKFGVTDFAASRRFFLEALAPLGVAVVAEGAPTYGVELCATHSNASLILHQTQEKPAHLHLAFTATTRQQVEAFYRAALAAGGRDNGPPGLRPQYHANYYAAFVIGPDGHNVEAVCHAPVEAGV
jgi:catechol 2,3-dioxygenase-like lactoylglutathione lyase family enzyme